MDYTGANPRKLVQRVVLWPHTKKEIEDMTVGQRLVDQNNTKCKIDGKNSRNQVYVHVPCVGIMKLPANPSLNDNLF